MDEKKVREILDKVIFRADNGLYDLSPYLLWITNEKIARLDGNFTPDELEAIAWWMRNKFKKKDKT